MFTCPICSKKLKQINATHLKSHNITTKEFKIKYSIKTFENVNSKKLRSDQRAFREKLYLKNPLVCAQCSVPIPYKKSIEKRHDSKKQKQRNLPGNVFCSRSCAATYKNTHKKKGTRVSKLELWLAQELTNLFPQLKFHFNRKDTINSELDIYIPSLRLAFELNGIYHYEPIHGQEKLNQIQNNDNRKFQACIEHNIELCIIDTSRLTYFKESNALLYLNIIKSIITNKQAVPHGFEP